MLFSFMYIMLRIIHFLLFYISFFYCCSSTVVCILPPPLPLNPSHLHLPPDSTPLLGFIHVSFIVRIITLFLIKFVQIKKFLILIRIATEVI